MPRLLVFLGVLFYLATTKAEAQSTNQATDTLFLKHVCALNLDKERALFTQELLQNSQLSTAQRLAVYTINADYFWENKKIDSCLHYYRGYQQNQGSDPKLQLRNLACLFFTQNWNQFSKDSLNYPFWESKAQAQILRLGLSIWKGDKSMKTSIIASFKPQNSLQEKSFSMLLQSDEKLTSFRKKSAFVAASMSALVPGLGKVYAGKPKQGIMAFLQCGVMGIQAVEAWRNTGNFFNPRTIVFGSFFSFFYIGNVLGSALEIKKRKERFLNLMRNEIHFAVRTAL